MIFLNYLVIVIRCGGTQEDKHAVEWKRLFKRVARNDRKIRHFVNVRRDEESLRTRRC